MSETIPFIPGTSPPPSGLLARYLPPIPGGIAGSWIRNLPPSSSWILDPFGAAPNLTVESAQLGKRVLVAANNPVSRFLLELAAQPPTGADLQSALAELAAVRTGDERLEGHLRSLYFTKCAQCSQTVEAEAFLWERDSPAPYARIYQCTHCDDTGERPVTQQDVDLAQSFPSGGLHRARALERIAPAGDPDRVHAEEALTAYLPRSIYALVTLINRLEVLISNEDSAENNSVARSRSLQALVLAAFDQGNILWSHQTDRPRPRQLAASPKFRENNLWLAIEQAARSNASNLPPVPLTIWPELATEAGGVTVFEGPIRELSSVLDALPPDRRIQIDAIVTAVPRPNQAFWTLSALWAGWLWGHEAIGPFIGVLRRRRYDWAWHCSALNLAFTALVRIPANGIPFFACISENESSFLSAVLLAAQQAGLEFTSLAIRKEWDLAQVQWRCNEHDQQPRSNHTTRLSPSRLEDRIVASSLPYLVHRGEPAPYIFLHASALSEICKENLGLDGGLDSPGENYSLIHGSIEASFSTQNGFVRFGGSEKSPETGSFWHNELTQTDAPLSDRVESEQLRILLELQENTLSKLDNSICQIFPGLYTPEKSLLRVCVESYTENSGSIESFSLRREDAQSMRRSELAAMHFELSELGSRLGYQSHGERPLIWMEMDDRPRIVFYILASAVIGEIIFSNPFRQEISVIVLPGARANLVLHKIRHNPLLAQEIDKGWRFLKYRHLRQLLDTKNLSRGNLDEYLSLDPLTESPAQMRMF